MSDRAVSRTASDISIVSVVSLADQVTGAEQELLEDLARAVGLAIRALTHVEKALRQTPVDQGARARPTLRLVSPPDPAAARPEQAG